LRRNEEQIVGSDQFTQGQVFGADGIPVGADFIVNTTKIGDHQARRHPRHRRRLRGSAWTMAKRSVDRPRCSIVVDRCAIMRRLPPPKGGSRSRRP
jgi:hypothetical protein